MATEVNIQKTISILIEPGIIENTFKGGQLIDDDDMRALRKANMSIVGDQPYTVLVQAEELINFTIKARELVASKEFRGNNVAKALLIRSLGQRIIANFYLKIHKPYIKTKLFSDRKKATDWLREEYKKHLHSKLKSALTPTNP